MIRTKIEINMMIPFSLIVLHFIGDFLFQDNWMALNKSKMNGALTVHVMAYLLPFWFWAIATNTPQMFLVWTAVLHWVTDYYTSRITSKLWFIDERGVDMSKRHWFFVMIGFDQLLHYAALAFAWSMV